MSTFTFGNRRSVTLPSVLTKYFGAECFGLKSCGFQFGAEPGDTGNNRLQSSRICLKRERQHHRRVDVSDATHECLGLGLKRRRQAVPEALHSRLQSSKIRVRLPYDCVPVRLRHPARKAFGFDLSDLNRKDVESFKLVVSQFVRLGSTTCDPALKRLSKKDQQQADDKRCDSRRKDGRP